MVPIKQRLDPDDHYDGANIIEFILLHDTGNYNDSDEGNAKFFEEATRNASAHYFVDDDSITQVVLDKDGAFHCGDGYGKYGITNRNSLGIEMCRKNGVVTPLTEANALELVKMKMAEHNVPASKVLRHYDASRKNCPSSFSANSWTRWVTFKKKVEGVFVMPAPIVNTCPTPVTEGILYIQRAMNRLWFTGANGKALVEDGKPGTNTIFAIKTFQRVCAIHVDGVAGDITRQCIHDILGKPLCGLPYVERTATRYIQWRFGIKADGVFGSTTAAYVKGYQREKGLDDDGVVGKLTWNKLIG